MKKLMCMAVAMIAIAAVVSAQETAKAAAPAPAVVEESPDTGFSFGATMDIYSAYVWRGCVLNDEPVWQPGATVSYATGDYGTLSAGVWASFNMTDRNNRTHFAGIDEIDYTLSYAIDVGPVSLSVGHIWYTFPSVSSAAYGHSTREVYATAALNNDIVTPFVKAYYDYEYAEGFYGNAGLTKSIEITDQFSAGAEISVGAGDSDYMGAYFGEDDAALADFNAAIFCSYAVTDNVSVGARIAWMSLIDSDVRDNEMYWDEDLLWGGINLAASF
jgi:outer membrane scaffolding protein for murein synthesis (MipA/OmpV family)